MEHAPYFVVFLVVFVQMNVLFVGVIFAVIALEAIVVNHKLSQTKILLAQKIICTRNISGKKTMFLVTKSKVKQVFVPFA